MATIEEYVFAHLICYKFVRFDDIMEQGITFFAVRSAIIDQLDLDGFGKAARTRAVATSFESISAETPFSNKVLYYGLQQILVPQGCQHYLALCYLRSLDLGLLTFVSWLYSIQNCWLGKSYYLSVPKAQL